MADKIRLQTTDGTLYLTPDTELLIEAGDLLYHASDEVFPASAQADQTGQQANEEYFAARFIGVAGARSPVGSATKIPVHCHPAGIYLFDCALGGAVSPGDLVAVSENGTADGLYNQTVIEATGVPGAIGVFAEPAGASATTCKVMLFPALSSAKAVDLDTDT